MYQADERVVARDSEESNYRLALETLFEPAGIPEERAHGMIPEGFLPDASMNASSPVVDRLAREYEERLPERLDLVILGLGADGHTASLFPGSPALTASDRRVVAAEAPVPPVPRLTLTPAVIAAARLVVVLVHGAGKADAVRAALAKGDPSEVPGRLARGGIWLIGSDALPR